MTEDLNEYQVCYKHHDRKTLLRCNKCNRPICLECAIQTPTGYRCKECVKEQQKIFNTSENRDYIIGGIIAAVMGFVGSIVAAAIPLLPSFLTAIVIGGLFGKLICSLVRSAVKKRRSQTLNYVITIAAGVGAALPRLRQSFQILKAVFLGQFNLLFSGTLQIGFSVLYIIVLCVTIWSDMNGMVFRN